MARRFGDIAPVQLERLIDTDARGLSRARVMSPRVLTWGKFESVVAARGRLPQGHSQIQSRATIVAVVVSIAAGTSLTSREGKSIAALSGTSDVDLFGDGKGVVDLHVDIAHCGVNLLVPLRVCNFACAVVNKWRLTSAPKRRL